MRVQVADGTVYDVNSCIRPKLTAETRKGSYAKQVTLRVMPLSLGVDVVLGGDWLRAQRRITFDYAQYGSVRFGHGSQKVVIAGCNPGSSNSERGQAMSLVEAQLISTKQARKDLRALKNSGQEAYIIRPRSALNECTTEAKSYCKFCGEVAAEERRQVARKPPPPAERCPEAPASPAEVSTTGAPYVAQAWAKASAPSSAAHSGNAWHTANALSCSGSRSLSGMQNAAAAMPAPNCLPSVGQSR
eukprot:gene14250-biopygen14689